MIFIIKTREEIERIDEILFKHFVYDEGFKFPFREGTTSYITKIGRNSEVCAVTNKILEVDDDKLQDLIGDKFYTYEQLVEKGYVTGD